MMRTEQAFLEDICSHPEDDGVRLIYADWLEERGVPGDSSRAEFIRVQCALCCFPLSEVDVPWDCPNEQDCLRLKEAVDNGEYEWLIPDWTQTREGDWSWSGHGPEFIIDCGSSHLDYSIRLYWRRGFIEAVELNLAEFSRPLATVLFASQPVERVCLRDREPWESTQPRYPHSWGWRPTLGSVIEAGFVVLCSTAARVPRDLLLGLEGFTETQEFPHFRFYPTKKEAHEALSQACVRWGRKQAGLPTS